MYVWFKKTYIHRPIIFLEAHNTHIHKCQMKDIAHKQEFCYGIVYVNVQGAGIIPGMSERYKKISSYHFVYVLLDDSPLRSAFLLFPVYVKHTSCLSTI